MARTFFNIIVVGLMILTMTWLHYIQEDINRLYSVTFDSARCIKEFGENEN